MSDSSSTPPVSPSGDVGASRDSGDDAPTVSTRPGSPRWATALVTGASSGIGEAFARSLAAEGSDVVLVARDVERLELLAGELRARYAIAAEVIGTDLSAPVSRAAIEKRLGDIAVPIDLLVNNAGFGTTGDFVDLPVGREEQEVQVNVLAVLRLTSAALGPMVARGSGTVINVSSLAGLYPSPTTATYAATKAFVTSFSEALHVELEGSGVVVTAVLPGFTRTEFQARANWTAQDGLPDSAWLTPETVVRESLDAAAAGKARVVPGRGYKVVAAASTPFSPSARRRVIALARRFSR